MNPREHYRKLAFSINDAEIRMVAAVMAEHIGEENAVRLDALRGRVGMDERKVRIILEKLVKEFGFPVGAKSGKAGRYLIANEQERGDVIADLVSRRAEIDERIRALRGMKLAPVNQVEAVQPTLVELPEPKSDYYYNWYRGA